MLPKYFYTEECLKYHGDFFTNVEALNRVKKEKELGTTNSEETKNTILGSCFAWRKVCLLKPYHSGQNTRTQISWTTPQYLDGRHKEVDWIFQEMKLTF